jgi:hypothetical protein
MAQVQRHPTERRLVMSNTTVEMAGQVTQPPLVVAVALRAQPARVARHP